MKPKHKDAILANLAEAEKWAFSKSTEFGRRWKAAYQEARKTHTIDKAILIADKTA